MTNRNDIPKASWRRVVFVLVFMVVATLGAQLLTGESLPRTRAHEPGQITGRTSIFASV